MDQGHPSTAGTETGRRFRPRSLRLRIAALLTALMAIVLVQVVKDATLHLDDYRVARRVIATNAIIDHLLQAGQNLAFERGRSTVVLRAESPISDHDRAFLATRRQAADRHLAAALDHSDDAAPIGPVRDGHAGIQVLRQGLDRAFDQPRAARDPALADRWFEAASALLRDIQDAIVAVSLARDHFSPSFRLLTRVKIQAFDLRDSMGAESARLAIALAEEHPLTAAQLAQVAGLRGRSVATWAGLRREIALTGNPALVDAMEAVERNVSGSLRPLQDRILAAAEAGGAYPVATADYTAASVPALDSIAHLMEVAATETRLHAVGNLDHAGLTLLTHLALAALALVLGAATMVTVSTRLLGPLRTIRRALRALGDGGLDQPLPAPRHRDELGEVQAALLSFRDGLVERQLMADELSRQRERLATLIDAMPDFVCFKDGDGRWLVVNEYGRRLFGLEGVDVVGKTDLDLARLSPHCRQSLCGCVDSDERAWRKGAISRSEEAVAAPDGRTALFDVVKVPLLGADGTRNGLVVVGRDITERRRIEALLARLSRQNELILECAGEGIVGLDARGAAIFVNPAAVRMTGWNLAELIGRHHHAVVHHSHADGTPHRAEDCPVGKTLLDGQPRQVADDVFWRKDGSSFPVEYTANAMVEQGEVRGAVIVFRDIGDRKRDAAAIQALLADLQRSNADLEQFAYAVSHDLQEPLRMVSSYVQLLRRRYEGKLDGDADEFIGFAVDGAQRMSSMINGLLEYARVGTRGAAPAPVSSAQALARALTNLAVAVAEGGARLTRPESMPLVMADDTQLVSVFQNLVANAIKYRRPDAPPEIAIAAARTGRMCRFSVTDNGLGIPAEARERVFGVFQRLEGRPDIGGTGMGLAICRRIVERLGGRIWAEEADGGGSRFVFTLPAADSEAGDGAGVNEL